MSGKSAVWMMEEALTSTNGCKFRRICASAAESSLTTEHGGQLIQNTRFLFKFSKFDQVWSTVNDDTQPIAFQQSRLASGSSINQPKADVTQIANAPGMVHSGCGLLTGSDFSVRSMYLFLEGPGEESHKTHRPVH